MKQTVVHRRILPAVLLAAFLPAMGAEGQYANESPPGQDAFTDYSDTRDQDYLRDVIELSATLGAAHAIRTLCNGRDDQYWRSYMQELLGLEAPFRSRLRTEMVDAFNAGYEDESRRRRRCDEHAVSAEKIYAETGKRLANALAEANFPEGVRRDATRR